MARAKPARLAPIAGERLDVREREIRGLRRRNGAASLVSRLERRREKKRNSSRCRRRMSERERESRKFGDPMSEVFFLFLC